jgi:hypothetical protein
MDLWNICREKSCFFDATRFSTLAATEVAKDQNSACMLNSTVYNSIHALNCIMRTTGPTREEAASELGRRGHDGAVNSIVHSAGFTRV